MVVSAEKYPHQVQWRADGYSVIEDYETEEEARQRVTHLQSKGYQARYLTASDEAYRPFWGD